HLELPEGPPRRPARDLARVAQRVGERLQGVVEGKRQVPRLRREDHQDRRQLEAHVARGEQRDEPEHQPGKEAQHGDALQDVEQRQEQPLGDRKSTRLNSSHGSISYAVFCLKKKNKNKKEQRTIYGTDENRSR